MIPRKSTYATVFCGHKYCTIHFKCENIAVMQFIIGKYVWCIVYISFDINYI